MFFFFAHFSMPPVNSSHLPEAEPLPKRNLLLGACCPFIFALGETLLGSLPFTP